MAGMYLCHNNICCALCSLALAGQPMIILLDEPSTGVDIHGRRQLYEILRAHRQSHSIILTTHYMEEADILADRVAVLTHGSLRCYGSSAFLKRHFGEGYHLK